MKAYEIIGGYAHICDMCNKDDGRPTLYWEEKDFDLCYECLEKLYKYNRFITEEDEKEIGIKIIRKTISEEMRNTIFKRDNYRCKICGDTNIFNLAIDHKIPFSKGGTTELDNLQTLCKKCNRDKGNKTNI